MRPGWRRLKMRLSGRIVVIKISERSFATKRAVFLSFSPDSRIGSPWVRAVKYDQTGGRSQVI
jgi:hypothetical protein